MKLACCAAGLLVLAATSVTGQTPLSFEVVSIKPSPPLTAEMLRSTQPHIGTRIDAARADFGNASLTTLISRAYGVRSFQVSGPDWMNTSRFDILAKLPEGSSTDQVPEMLQTLLAARFKLAIHRESKEFPAYALIVAKDGPKLTARPADYDPAGKFMERPMTLEALADLLSAGFDKPVIDKTDIKGEYMMPTGEIQKEIVGPMLARARAAAAAAGGGLGDGASEPTGTGMSSIIQKLGLKVEARKMAMPLIVVDHLEKTPTEEQ